MDNTFYDGHNELYHHAKFGEEHTVHADCRCENVVFVFFVMLQVRQAVRSTVTYFEQVLCRGLWVDFDAVYIVFSALIALSNALGNSD